MTEPALTVRPAHAEQGPELGTRDRVRALVSEFGPVTAADIACRLDLTPAAVRRHLDALAQEGSIAERDAPPVASRGRGRPARAYVLTASGHTRMQTTYDGMATAALDFLAEQVGQDAVEDFAKARIGELESRLATGMRGQLDGPGRLASADLTERTAALVDALSTEGYAASARPVGGGASNGIQLCQGHCPIQHVAHAYPAFCEAETDAFSRLLGVHVQRLATLAHGEHVCTTFVPTGALPTTSAARRQKYRSDGNHTRTERSSR